MWKKGSEAQTQFKEEHQGLLQLPVPLERVCGKLWEKFLKKKEFSLKLKNKVCGGFS